MQLRSSSKTPKTGATSDDANLGNDAVGQSTQRMPTIGTGRRRTGNVVTDPLFERRELAEDLDGMAATIGEVDPRSSERLSDLARSIGTEEGRIRWADVDLRRAFNTERLAAAYAERREGSFAAGALEIADRARQVLVLVPILLTWYALYEATRAYSRFIAANPDEVRKPFLLLWQEGFGGELGGLAPTFSTVAIIDAAIILLIILLTFYAHGRKEARDERIDQVAERFQTDLDNVLATATVALGADRGSRPAQLSHNVERLADRFDRNSQELLNRLRVEHDRLEQIAVRREREFQDFGVFASGMRAGAEETHRLLVDLRQVSKGLQTALEDLTSEVGVSGDQSRHLLAAVTSLERIVGSGIQSDNAVTRQLADAANAITGAADQSVSGAQEAAHAGRVAAEAVRGIAEMTMRLADSQGRMEQAVLREADQNSRLADALLNSVGGVAGSTKRLEEIGGGLTGLRDEFKRLAQQTAEQANLLRTLLGEQSKVAAGLSQSSGDVSKVSIVTAQRQREVNDNIAKLLSQLEQLTATLGRSAATASPESLERAFQAALRSELSAQADMIADAIEVRASGDRPGGIFHRSQRRPGGQ